MRRADLEHLLRACAEIAGDDVIVVVGSQAILGQYPDAPEAMLVSIDADVYPRSHPERAEVIDGSIGELSPFHRTFGYYAHGVGPDTAVLPEGWEERLVSIRNPNTRGVEGLCLEVHDLLVSKYVAGREKDREFARVAADHRLAEGRVLLERLATTRVSLADRSRIAAFVRADFRL